MSITTVTAAQAMAADAPFDAVIDVRSPAEFAEDHLPGALNWPVLDDDERRIVGTLYVQDSPLAARKVGGALVARNLARHVEQQLQDRPRDWRPLVYCWRGGQRSGALVWMLDQIGFRTHKLGGGYKAFRSAVRAELDALPAALTLTVLAGRTGSGKTRLLGALATEGAQVLDLEALAAHRGSVLGGLPDQPQPSQKRFDTLLWSALRALDPARPVFVESESKKIGQLQLPESLVRRMRDHGRCIRVAMDDAARTQLLLQDYGFFAAQPQRFCDLLDGLNTLRGRERVLRWQTMAHGGDWATLFGELMREHYDPLYEQSMASHYPGLAGATVVELADGGPDALRQAARAALSLVEQKAGIAAP
ncbi:MAG: tRNA 2-selenouridine(34) synthase MnmH [Aquabacterium sp.]